MFLRQPPQPRQKAKPPLRRFLQVFRTHWSGVKKSKYVVSEPLGFANARPESDGSQGPALRWWCRKRGWHSSSPARNCVWWLTAGGEKLKRWGDLTEVSI